LPGASRREGEEDDDDQDEDHHEDQDDHEDDDEDEDGTGLDLSVSSKRQPRSTRGTASPPTATLPEEGSPQFPSPSLLYYYCLLNEQNLRPRAAVAAAMADAYSILNEKANQPQMASEGFNENLAPRYREDDSPEHYSGRTELRSADTTNGLEPNGERKRISRPLTGRHVRHGTGASPSTLVTLRNMLKERQRLKESGLSGHKIQGKNKGARKRRK